MTDSVLVVGKALIDFVVRQDGSSEEYVCWRSGVGVIRIAMIGAGIGAEIGGLGVGCRVTG